MRLASFSATSTFFFILSRFCFQVDLVPSIDDVSFYLEVLEVLIPLAYSSLGPSSFDDQGLLHAPLNTLLYLLWTLCPF